jgi:UDP-N-acetylmuramate--alanine ligase
MYGRARAIHFIGIGGSGMSGLAEVLLTTGYRCPGSDLKTERGHRPAGRDGRARVQGPQRAQRAGRRHRRLLERGAGRQPRAARAIARGVPVIPRADMLAELMRMKYGIAIAGAHGKTTTTSMVGQVLLDGGSIPRSWSAAASTRSRPTRGSGHGRFLVAEADESDGSFVRLTPAIGVITNLDQEHMDHYGTMAGVEAAFLEFAERTPFYGLVGAVRRRPGLAKPDAADLAPLDHLRHRGRHDPRLEPRAAQGRLALRREQGAEHAGRDRAAGRRPPQRAQRARRRRGRPRGRDPVPADRVRALALRGRGRRFEKRGESNDVLVGRRLRPSPDEIKATLAAATQLGRERVVVCFQPHRSRARGIWRRNSAPRSTTRTPCWCRTSMPRARRRSRASPRNW